MDEAAQAARSALLGEEARLLSATARWLPRESTWVSVAVPTRFLTVWMLWLRAVRRSCVAPNFPLSASSTRTASWVGADVGGERYGGS